MADVRSKNPFELLGDEEETTQTTTKLTRNEKKILKNEVVDNSRATPRENRLRNDYPKRGGYAGKSSRPTRSEGGENRRGGDRSRRGREYKGRGREFDRHSGSARRDSQKKDVAGKGTWGKETENLEDVVDVEQQNENEEEVKETKPEEKLMTLEDYLASQAKKTIVNENTIRTANEGVDESKWGETVELSKDEEAYFVGKNNEKTHRVKKQKEKTFVYEIEQRFNDNNRRGGRGGRQNRNNNKRPANNKVNVDDTNDFPSLK